jgi:amino acid adenylation domain-containing protein
MTDRDDSTDARGADVGGIATLAALHDPRRLADVGVDPGAVALTDGTATSTWAEADRRIGRLAALLRACGVEAGDRVGVHLRKSVDSFVAVHAVLRAGAVMVPLDPLASVDPVRAVLDEVGAKVVVTDARPAVVEALAGTAALGAVVTPVSEDPTDPAGTRTAGGGAAHGPALVPWRPDDVSGPTVPAAECRIGPDDPAYVIPTSGSTGRPKGIVHTHRSALAYAAAAARTYGLTTADRLANVASLHFDQSTFELYAAPLAGASVLVVPDTVLRFPASVAELLERERATVWYSVPYVLRQLEARGALRGRRLSLRWILFGGEPYPPDELARLMALVPAARVSNVYGPAEVNQCTFHHLDRPPDPARPVPIGRAWSAAEVVVVDPDAHPPVPSRAAGDGRRTGELLVATPTMMRGYWGRPELTRSAIVEASFPGRTGTRWYRTGDLVVDDGGELVFAGRLDHQVKLRGQRVELEAVEAVLREVPGVRDAAAVVDRGPTGEPRLVGVVVADGEIDERAVRRAVRATLPAAAVPEELAVTDVLPRSSNGKLDRAGVLSRLGRASSSPAGPHASRTAEHTDPT